MLKISGDKIIFNDFEVATISEDLPPSLREAFEAEVEQTLTVYCPNCDLPINLAELD